MSRIQKIILITPPPSAPPLKLRGGRGSYRYSFSLHFLLSFNCETRKSFKNNFANEVEKIHADLYKKAVENLGKNPSVDYHVCQVCGNTVEGEPPDKCPICGANKKMFKKID